MTIKAELKIINKSGLHARPAVVFVKVCRKYKSKITIEKNGKKADAKNILQVLSLGVDQGDTITITIEGEDEEEAFKEIKETVEKRLVEVDKK
ncbi:MAG: HPr family phosphocarrier protein [Crenarchaeota archaeon]|nr:HPr family phosphocarrier protein [Thermoproteota archaeon]